MFFVAGGLFLALLVGIATSQKRQPSAAEIEVQRQRDLQLKLEMDLVRKLGGIPSAPTVSRGRWDR